MKKFQLSIIVLLAEIGFSFSQQLPQYSQWSMHQFALNPAHAGIKKCVDIHSLYRTQWVGFEGAPKSGFLSVSIPLSSKRRQYLSARHGTGFKFESDQIGQFSTNRLNLAYAAHFNFNKIDRLSLGLYGGVMQMAYDPTLIHTTDPDPSILNQASFVVPDATFGAWFNSENYYIGLTLQNLIPSKWKNIGDNARNRIHTALNAGYQFSLGENASLLPAVLIKIPPRGPLAVDLNLNLDYKNTFGIGVGYRNTDALIVFVSLKIKEQFAIIYSFDYILSQIQRGAQNTHEISLRFTTCKRQKSSTSSCPLFE